jgi:hypothetical protein
LTKLAEAEHKFMNKIQSYSDVEIRILEQMDEGYPVEITLNGEKEFSRSHIDPDQLALVADIAGADDTSASEVGDLVFDCLAADPTFLRNWSEIRGATEMRRLRLRLDSSAPELHLIPWELIRDTSSEQIAHHIAASTATPFSRYLAGTWQPGNPVLKRPIRMLLAIAAPEDLSDYGMAAIDINVEARILLDVLDDVDQVDVTVMSEPCTLAVLERELRNGYHILHFVGHGGFLDDADSAFLIMADEENRAAPITESAFAEMLARRLADTEQHREDKLRLVYLSSCQSATRSETDAFRGIAPSLVAAGVPAVIAMQTLMEVRSAQLFSREFYLQLLKHGQVDLACNEARSTLISSGHGTVGVAVLLMRLRSGLLFAKPGVITSEHGETEFWTYLLDYIAAGQCTPFLGPRINDGLLPDAAAIANALAARHNYPLDDPDNLAKVAQYISFKAPGVLQNNYFGFLKHSLMRSMKVEPDAELRQQLPRMSFSQLVRDLDWANSLSEPQTHDIYQILASFKLPLYITTNVDNFMLEALANHGVKPRRVGLRWNLQEDASREKYVILPPPSSEEPVVLHLNGHDDDPEQRQNLVLSEDDFLTHFVRISRDRNDVLPMNLLQLIAQNSFLFLGYRLEDWEFRIILQGLLQSIAKTGSSELHVGVQMESSDLLDSSEAMEYLTRYLGRFNIDIYWGKPQQFIAEMFGRWEQYSGDWDEW